MRNCFAGAFLGAPFAGHAEIPDSEFNRFVGNQREVREDLGQPNPGSELRCDQKPVSSQLAQTRVYSQGDATGRIVAHRNGPVPQPTNVLRHHCGYEGHLRKNGLSSHHAREF